jgi:hypothetical protein
MQVGQDPTCNRFRKVHQRGGSPEAIERHVLNWELAEIGQNQWQRRISASSLCEQRLGTIQTHNAVPTPAKLACVLPSPATEIQQPRIDGEMPEPFGQ